MGRTKSGREKGFFSALFSLPQRGLERVLEADSLLKSCAPGLTLPADVFKMLISLIGGGAMQRTGAVCQKAAAPLKAIGVTVSEESIRAYLEDLNHRGRREETVRFYAAKLKTFYDYLPPDKQIVLNTLETWRQALLAEGYAPATVNTNISAAGDGNGTPVGTDPNGISAAAVCCPGAGKGENVSFGESNCPDRSPCRRTASDHCGGRAEWTHTSCLRR